MDMESILDKLQRLGLTEYEGRLYVCLLKGNVDGAAKLAKRAGVPRTKVYSTLESLAAKGWIRIYSGMPLLYKAVEPETVTARIRREHEDLLDAVKAKLNPEALIMKDKFVILKKDIGLDGLKEEIQKGKTVWVNNATGDFLKRITDAFSPDAEIKTVMFPGERPTSRKGIQVREAQAEIVCIIRGKETPSMNVIVDETRVFTIVRDPVDGRYQVDEMLYDDCASCLNELYYFGWNAASEVR